MKKLLVSIFVGIFLTLFSGMVFAANLQMTWNPNPEADVAGYRVHYGTSSGLYSQTVDAGNSTSFQITGLADQGYYFAISAYDGNGNESAPSREIYWEPGLVPLELFSVTTPDPTTIELHFSERLAPEAALDPSRYLIDGTTHPVQVELLADGTTVRLTTFLHLDNQAHSVELIGLEDISGIALSTGMNYQSDFGQWVNLLLPSQYAARVLTDGVPYYVDSDWRVGVIPPAYHGSILIQTAAADAGLSSVDAMQFSVADDAIVYVGYDSEATSPPDWLKSGFIPVGPGPETDDGTAPYAMWARNYPAGDITLGGNSAPGADGGLNQYIVLVQPMKDGQGDNDTDHDGMEDEWENTIGLNANLFDAHGDPDGDGLTNLQEFWRDSDPLVADTAQTPGNRAPVAVTAATVTGAVGMPMVLDASGSYDPDSDLLTWAWTHRQGAPVSHGATDGALYTFTPGAPGLYVIGLVVSDGRGGTGGMTLYVDVVDTLLASASAASFVSLVLPDGTALEVTSGTVDPDRELSIGQIELPAPLPQGYRQASKVIHLGPSPEPLRNAVVLYMPYVLLEGNGPYRLLHYDAENGQWGYRKATQQAGYRMEAQVSELGTYVVAKAGGGAAGGGAAGGCAALPPGSHGAFDPLLPLLLLLPLVVRYTRRYSQMSGTVRRGTGEKERN